MQKEKQRKTTRIPPKTANTTQNNVRIDTITPNSSWSPKSIELKNKSMQNKIKKKINGTDSN